MAKKGLLINYDYCTGCHTCEVACKQEHGYPADRWGIMVKDCTRETVDKVQVDFLPFPTDLCDLCAKRIKAGEKDTACVKHCPAACMYYGPIAELAKRMEKKSKTVLFAPK